MSDENTRVAVLRVRLNREKAVSQHAGKERRRAETRIGSKPATEKRDDRQHSDGEKRNSTRERTRAMYVGGNSRQCRMEEKERRRAGGGELAYPGVDLFAVVTRLQVGLKRFLAQVLQPGQVIYGPSHLRHGR